MEVILCQYEEEWPVGQAGGPPDEEVYEEEPDYIEELERLAGLKEKGIISDEDFEAKKKQLLGF
jgi:hypothetical protein